VGRSPSDRPRDDLGHAPPIRAHPPLPCNKPPQREGRSRRIRSDPSSRCLRLGNEPWHGQTELPRHRHSSAKRARCSPAVRSALVPASEPSCRRQPTAEDHRSDISARSGAFSSARLVRQGSSPKGRNGEAGSSAADEPGPQGDAQFLLTPRGWLNLALPEEKLLRTREEPRTVR